MVSAAIGAWHRQPAPLLRAQRRHFRAGIGARHAHARGSCAAAEGGRQRGAHHARDANGARAAAARAHHTIAVGDRRGILRDASNACGWLAIACDQQLCESAEPGYFYHGDGDDLVHGPRWERLFTFAPCEQQTLSLGLEMSATKALDGRLWWGCVGWLLWWCIPVCCAYAEQPRVWIAELYDAPFVTTSPSEWADEWQKTTYIFYRGAAPPAPPFPGRKGTSAWHQERRWASAEEKARVRDELQPKFAAGLAAQLVPSGAHAQPDFRTEVQRLAAAFYAAGLPLPADYANPTGRPTLEVDRAYALSRGRGDGRMLAGDVVPELIADPQAWLGVAAPPVSERARQLGNAVAARRLTASMLAAPSATPPDARRRPSDVPQPREPRLSPDAATATGQRPPAVDEAAAVAMSVDEVAAALAADTPDGRVAQRWQQQQHAVPADSTETSAVAARATHLSAEAAAATRGPAGRRVPTLPPGSSGARLLVIPVRLHEGCLEYLLPAAGGTLG